MEVIRPTATEGVRARVRVINSGCRKANRILTRTSVFLQFQLGSVKHDYNNET